MADEGHHVESHDHGPGLRERLRAAEVEAERQAPDPVAALLGAVEGALHPRDLAEPDASRATDPDPASKPGDETPQPEVRAPRH